MKNQLFNINFRHNLSLRYYKDVLLLIFNFLEAFLATKTIILKLVFSTTSDTSF